MSDNTYKELEEKKAVVSNESEFSFDVEGAKRSEPRFDAEIRNPLVGLAYEEIERRVYHFVKEKGLEEHQDVFLKGALCAQVQDSGDYSAIKTLSEEEHHFLRQECERKWRQPFLLYFLAICCSIAAAVQGADESVINGALLYFPSQFGLFTDYCDYYTKDPYTGVCNEKLLPHVNPSWTRQDVTNDISKNNWLLGLVSSAPYLCCAVLGCWVSSPMNKYFGRRGATFVSSLISFATCIWQAVTNKWWHLFLARFIMGFGIGPKSATVPIYAAECAPPLIRGALVMQWQTWTAFGVMLGSAFGLMFYQVKDTISIHGLNWRLMLGSACIPAIFVMAQIYLCPESPRWLMKQGLYKKAFASMQRLRNTPLLAARDLFLAHCLIELEHKSGEVKGHNAVWQLFSVPRIARATWASTIVMFGQQFCGVNVITFYSSTIIQEANNDSIRDALLGSWGFGFVAFVFTIPAWYSIDIWGRRTLLLFTLPFLAIFLLITGFSFWIDHAKTNTRLGVVLMGIYVYAAFYGMGMGPVPFTYSAEAFPLHVRDVAMSYATAVLWFFNFILSITWFRMKEAFTAQGSFGWYAAWCIILWLLVLLFVPETKGLTLEELDNIFSVPLGKQVRNHVRMLWYKGSKVMKRS